MTVCFRCEALFEGPGPICKHCVRGQKAEKKQKKKHLLNDNKSEIHAYLWSLAEQRARIKDLPIKRHPVDIPDYCPILGVRMRIGEKILRDNSYSFDRIIPELGYVPGNVICISQRANRIKNNATLDELQKITNFYTDFLN